MQNSIEIELGDLLVIRQHFQFGNATPEGRAFIIQAKASTSPKTGGLSKEDVKQLNLYKNWGCGFTFPYGEFGAPSNAAKWDFSKCSSKVDETGVYGVVLSTELSASSKAVSRFPDGCVWGIGLTRDEVSFRGRPSIPTKNQSLADALSQLITGSFGRPWDGSPTQPDDHWSEFINEVLTSAVMRNSFAALQRIGGIAVPRSGHVLGFAMNMPGVALALQQSHEFYYPNHNKPLRKQVLKWMDSVNKFKDLPPSLAKQQPIKRSTGGMSFVYVATFGESRLAEVSNSQL